MQNHSKKIAMNSMFSIIYKIVILLVNFISRKLLIIYIGEEILGLNSLFSDLLSFLNLADLGIGVSVQFSLYKPIVEHDQAKVCRIIKASKKIFEYIGITIIAVGLMLTFFLDKLIADNPYSDGFLRIVYFLNVLSVSLTYFVAHKKIFLQAKEEIYILNIIDTISQLLGTVLKIIAIVVFKNYYYYVLISVIAVLFSNIAISYFCKKKYPYLESSVKVETIDQKEILVSLKDVIPLKLGTYLYTSTDNVIISSFLGLSKVAVYSNYMLITNSVMQFCYMVADAFKASFGNVFCEGRSKEILEEYFNTYMFLQFMISSFCAVSLWCLLTPFVEIFFGSNFVLPNAVVNIIVIDMFIHSMYQPLSMVFGALGKFKEDKVITLGIDIVNIILSILLVKKIGIIGPIIGTLISNILTWFFRTYQIVYKELSMDVVHFVNRIVKYFIFTLFEILVTSYICEILFESCSIFNFLGRVILCVLIPNVMNILCWHRTPEFLYLFQKVKHLIPVRGEK